MRTYHGLSDPAHGLVVWVTTQNLHNSEPKQEELKNHSGLKRENGTQVGDLALAYDILYDFLGYRPRNRVLVTFTTEVTSKLDGGWALRDEEIADWLLLHSRLAYGE